MTDLHRTNKQPPHQKPTDVSDLAQAITEFEQSLPGWSWTLESRILTKSAMCGPERDGPDGDLLNPEANNAFAEEFIHEFDKGTGSLAKALRAVMRHALFERNEYRQKHRPSDKP
jgi:hypothetical protein